jgi:hypothetical protein
LWVLVRVFADRGGPWRTVFAAMVVTGIAILGASVLLGGIQPWLDYVAVVRAGAGAELVDPRNLAPVSLLGQATGMDAGTLRVVQAAVAILAALAAVLAAWRVRDPIASLGIAFTASLVVLPVTWYHYPVALVPIGLALAITRPWTRAWIVAAIVIADLALVIGPLLWVSVGLVVAAAFLPDRRALASASSPVAT